MSGWGSQRISASADALPLTRGLIDTLAAPRAAGTTATLAPAREAAPSIHASLVRATEEDLTGGMQDLRVDTVERNAELVRQLDDVAARTEAASRTLTDEVIARRVAAFDAQRARVEAALSSLEAEFSARITSTFAAHDASLREPSSRLDAACAAEADCYTRELPHLYDSCCGAAECRMRVEQEALQLDMAGNAAREYTLHERLDSYAHTAHERGLAEAGDRLRQYTYLNGTFSDAFSRLEASANALEARHFGKEDGHLTLLARAIAAEASAREAGDMAFVSNMRLVMGRLQALAADLFGAEESEG